MHQRPAQKLQAKVPRNDGPQRLSIARPKAKVGSMNLADVKMHAKFVRNHDGSPNTFSRLKGK